MGKIEDINKIFGVSEAFLAPGALMEILWDKEKREDVFFDMMRLHDYDRSYDWFHEYFQEEHADRAKKKQDFTPPSLSRLVSELGDEGIIQEPACGTGSMVIAHWNRIKTENGFFGFEPSSLLFELEELSDKTIPFLLFNLMIRGVNAIVIHGNALTREAKGAFLIQNYDNDVMSFSDLNVLPYTKYTEKLLEIRFIEHAYPKHVERSLVDEVKAWKVRMEREIH